MSSNSIICAFAKFEALLAPTEIIVMFYETPSRRIASVVAVASMIFVFQVSTAEASSPSHAISVSAGASYNVSVGATSTEPPELLEIMPEVQFRWGGLVTDTLLILGRFEFLGFVMPIPFGQMGVGLDLVVDWVPALVSDSWSPEARFSAGAIYFGSGGEELPGPDYGGFGYRFGLEGGISRSVVMTEALYVEAGTDSTFYGSVVLSLLAGVQTIGFPKVMACEAGAECSENLLGPSLRFEVKWFF